MARRTGSPARGYRSRPGGRGSRCRARPPRSGTDAGRRGSAPRPRDRDPTRDRVGRAARDRLAARAPARGLARARPGTPAGSALADHLLNSLESQPSFLGAGSGTRGVGSAAGGACRAAGGADDTTNGLTAHEGAAVGLGACDHAAEPGPVDLEPMLAGRAAHQDPEVLLGCGDDGRPVRHPDQLEPVQGTAVFFSAHDLRRRRLQPDGIESAQEGQLSHCLSRGDVPYPQRLVLARGDDEVPVRRERACRHGVAVTSQGAHQRAGGDVPYPQRLVRSSPRR